MTGVALLVAAAAAAPIPQGPDAATLPAFAGRAVAPRPLSAPAPPRHPHMAPNGRSNIHDDAYQSDTYTGLGPLATGGIDTLSAYKGSECASITFDARGRLVTVCVGLAGPQLQLIDPRTLETLASFELPPWLPGSGNPFTNFAGGGYFYLDDHDRAVIPTTTRHVLVVALHGDAFAQEGDFDLTGAVGLTDQVISALPDFEGRIWFASKAGVVGTVDPASRATRALDLHEGIGNSFAVGPDGVYIVTDAALYRLAADVDGIPRVQWRTAYANTGATKSGQTQPGSGTTPTLMGERYVAITDNDDPIKVVVARRADGGVVCTEPLFAKGASSTDQSLIATDSIIVAENNFGYSSPTATEHGHTTSAGLQRVDVENGRCRTVWRSRESAPSAVPKLSLAAGLLYTYAKPARDDGQDAWYLTALDVRTGATVFRRLGGEGLGFNNNYAPITLGPDGTAYLGVLGGIVAWRDRRPPAGTPARRPRVALRVSCLRGGRARLTLTGAGVARVTFTRARAATAPDRSRRWCAGRAASARTRCCATGACCASHGAAASSAVRRRSATASSTSDQDPPDFAVNPHISAFRRRLMGIQAMPMSEPSVSDLVFRDLHQEGPQGRAFDDAWEASLREELEKLRPVRAAPRVIPAADIGDRASHGRR